MDLSPSSEAANCAATQEVPNFLWNPNIHYRVRQEPSIGHNAKPDESSPNRTNLPLEDLF
jgi:hypothetical protein